MSKVLIVESEPWLADHYQRTLERQGFAITRASNAYSAMAFPSVYGVYTALPE